METLITSGSHANTVGVVEPGVHLADHTSGTARLCGDDVAEYECDIIVVLGMALSLVKFGGPAGPVSAGGGAPPPPL